VASLTYGFDPQFDVYAQDIVNEGYSTRFDCYHQGRKLGAVDLVVPGRHNVLNALATIALGLKLGIPFKVMADSLQTFYGVKRRFQLKGNFDDIMVIDDYGHHPTEIMATLSAAKSFNRKRIVVAFQPHRYSRTKFLMEEFVKSFALSDYLVVTDVYAASERPSEGADIQELYAKLNIEYGAAAVYLKKEKIVEHLLEMVKPGDLLLTLGAGDITQLSDQFITAWHQRHPSEKPQKLNA